MPAPPPEVLAAVVAGQTTVTRRVEIYEADGITLFSATPRLTSLNTSQITVDYTRDERRNMDITLDNSDGGLIHAPGQLWYDKVVKVYRGVKFSNAHVEPTIAVIDPTANGILANYLVQLGYSDIAVFTSAGVNDLLGFDIVAASETTTADITAPTAATLLACWNAGINVMTISPYATTLTVPLIASLVSLGTQTTGQWNFAPPLHDAPFQTFQAFTSNRAGTVYTMPATLTSGTYEAAHGSFVSNAVTHTGSLALYAINSSGARWFHYHGPITDTIGSTPAAQYALWHYNRDIILHSALAWLFPISTDQTWETQIGEFLIDKIESYRTPRTIEITGRDYTKKLKNQSFDNATSFAPGILLDVLVQALAALADISKFRLGSGGALTTATATFTSANSYWDAILAMCQAANVEVFFDAFGYLVTRPFLDPTLSPVTLVLSQGDETANLVDWDIISDDSQLYNRVVVTSSSDSSATTGLIYQGIAENHEPSSPTSIENLNQVRSYYYSSPFFTSNDQCLAYAQSLLSVTALESYELDYTSIVFAWLEAGEIIQCELPDAQPTDPTRFLSISFIIPMSLDPMTGVAKRVTIVGPAS